MSAEGEEDDLPEPVLVFDEATNSYTVLHDPPPPPTPEPPAPRKGILPWLPGEIDLRKYGFAMVLDFGWPDAGAR